MTNTRQTEVRILKLLCNFNTYNQNSMTKLIGLDPEKSTHRVQVFRAIKKLSRYLERKRNDLDELGKKWVMKRDIEIIGEMSKEYPEILELLMYNTTIQDMVYEKHVDLVNEMKYIHYDTDPSIKFTERIDFLTDLNFSPTFFKLWLQNSSEVVDQKLIYLSSKTSSYINLEGRLPKHPAILKRSFRACAVTDVVNGYVRPTGLEVEKMFEPPFS